MSGVYIGLVAVLLAALAALWVAAAGYRRTLEAHLAAGQAEMRRIADASAWREQGTEEIRREVGSFRETLEGLRLRDEERRAREEQSWAVLHRVSSVLTGGQKTGRAGENVLRESLACLPPSMVVTDFRVNGRVVEFGLVMPDGRRLPVDSKWPAEREVLKLAETVDASERDRLVRVIERVVTERAREVSGYRDASVTSPLAVAAVPDAAYSVLRRAHADAYRQGVIVVPYSMALPVVLFLYGIVSRFGGAGDVESCLVDLAALLDAVEATLENKVAKASTMLANGSEELRGHVGKARSTLARARETDDPAHEQTPPKLVVMPS